MMIRLASVLCPVLAASCALLVAFGGTGGDYARSRTMPAPMIEPAPPALVPARVEAPSALPAIAHDPGALVARSLNAITPFATRPLVAAPSFVMGGGFADRERAVDCLAAAAYYEAGTGAEDQRAVAQVILNRMRHPAFPHTVCGVVFQGSERSTGCQFTFTCDGSIARRQPSALNWRKAQLVAEDMLSGRVEAEVGLATHYHTDWVMPSWNREMDKIAAIKTHLFFQWRGARGGPASFVTGHLGNEPRIARLQAFSFAHRSMTEPFGPAAAETVLAPTAAPALVAVRSAKLSPGVREALPDRASAPDQNDFLVTLAAADGPDSFLRMAERSCSGRRECRFIGWTDPARRASQLPMPGSSVDAISFTFIRHEGGDQPAKARWNCTEFPRPDRSQCLRRGD